MTLHDAIAKCMGEAATEGYDAWLEDRWGNLMPYYNAEDDSWFDVLPRLWFDADGAKVTVTGYKLGDGPWIPLPRPLPVVDSGMPIIVTQSPLRGKVIYGFDIYLP